MEIENQVILVVGGFIAVIVALIFSLGVLVYTIAKWHLRNIHSVRRACDIYTESKYLELAKYKDPGLYVKDD